MNSRMNNTEEKINDLEDRLMEITQSKKQTENQMNKNESNMNPGLPHCRQILYHLNHQGSLEVKNKGLGV